MSPGLVTEYGMQERYTEWRQNFGVISVYIWFKIMRLIEILQGISVV